MKAEVHVDRPSTWRKYKNGLCEDCQAGCCTLPLEVSALDLIQMGLTTEEEAGLSMKALAKRLKKEKLIDAFHLKSGIFVIARTAMGDCLFLGKDRRCQIYEKRPQVCRSFPKIGPRPGFCPHKIRLK